MIPECYRLVRAQEAKAACRAWEGRANRSYGQKGLLGFSGETADSLQVIHCKDIRYIFITQSSFKIPTFNMCFFAVLALATLAVARPLH